MTSTQKRYLEWPIFFAVVWLWQSFEVSLFQLPFEMGALQLLPLLSAFVAMFMPLKTSFLLSFVFSFVASTNLVFPHSFYISATLWSVLVLKSLVSSFTLESRRDFALMSATFVFSLNLFLWLLLEVFSEAPPFWKFFSNTILLSLVHGLLGFMLYQVFAFWFEFFEYKIEEHREDELRRAF